MDNVEVGCGGGGEEVIFLWCLRVECMCNTLLGLKRILFTFSDVIVVTKENHNNL